MNEIRNAMLWAADWIEKNPCALRLTQPRVWNGTGCPLAWAGGYLGESDAIDMLARIRGHEYCQWMPSSVERDHEFTKEMAALAGVARFFEMTATQTAKAFRAYADKYHPAVKTPDWNAIAHQTLREAV